MTLGHVYGSLFALLILVAKVDLRLRDPNAALQGIIDPQIAVELACWALVGAWVGLRLLHPHRWLLRAFPAEVGPAMRCYLALGALSLVSAVVLRGTPLPTVRALQLLVLLGVAVLVQRDVRWGRVDLLHVWAGLARVLVAVVVGLMVLAVVFPELTSVRITYFGFSRYRLMQMAPTSSAQLMGLALVVCAAEVLVKARRMHALEQALFAAAAPVLAAGIWATKARGALIATIVAVGVLVVLTPRGRRRAVVLLGTALASVPVLAGVFDGALRSTLLRGQTEEQLLSLTGRTELFAYAWELFTQRPALGYGYLTSRDVFLERFPWAGESHNALVDIALSFGLVGLVLYLWMFGLAAWSIRRGLAAPGEREVAAVAAALLVWTLVEGVGAESYGGTVGPGVLALVLVAVLTDHRRWLGSRTAVGS